MNDNKFINYFGKFFNNNDITGAVLEEILILVDYIENKLNLDISIEYMGETYNFKVYTDDFKLNTYLQFNKKQILYITYSKNLLSINVAEDVLKENNDGFKNIIYKIIKVLLDLSDKNELILDKFGIYKSKNGELEFA